MHWINFFILFLLSVLLWLGVNGSLHRVPLAINSVTTTIRCNELAFFSKGSVRAHKNTWPGLKLSFKVHEEQLHFACKGKRSWANQLVIPKGNMTCTFIFICGISITGFLLKNTGSCLQRFEQIFFTSKSLNNHYISTEYFIEKYNLLSLIATSKYITFHWYKSTKFYFQYV